MNSQPNSSRHPLKQTPESRQPVHPLENPPPVAPEVRTPPKIRIEVPQQTPFLSYVIIGVNLVVFIIDFLVGGRLTDMGAKDNIAILNGEIWRLFTPLFLHGGIIHLGLNSYSLYIIGPQIERTFGRWRFIAIYFLSGLAASVASLILSPYRSIGASGALFGLIGAMIPLLYHNRRVLDNTQRRIRNVISVIIYNLIYGFAINLGSRATGVGIDNWAHLGGLLSGLALAWFTAPRYVIRLSTIELARIEDTSSLSVSWLVYSLATLVLLGFVGFTIYLY